MTFDTNLGEVAWFCFALLGTCNHGFWMIEIGNQISRLEDGEVVTTKDVIHRFERERAGERDRMISKLFFAAAAVVAMLTNDRAGQHDAHISVVIYLLFLGLVWLDVTSLFYARQRFRDLYGEQWHIVVRWRLRQWFHFRA